MISIKRTLISGMLAIMTITAADAYTGGLSSSAGEINGTGFWVNQSALPVNEQPAWVPVTMNWAVTQNSNGSWHYNYILNVYRANVSHMIIETSTNFTTADILNAQGQYANLDIGWQKSGPGNPYMPEDIYGIKFDATTSTNVNVSFDSWRIPVWGDFYAKCGNVGGTQNTAWNTGFLATDPTGAASDGSLENHILVPDTRSTTVVPEPSSLATAMLGFSGLAVGFRRRIKR